MTCESKQGQSKGVYSDTVPVCQNEDNCKGVDCQNGKCVDGVNEFTCTCNAGYKADANKYCSIKVDSVVQFVIYDLLMMVVVWMDAAARWVE